MTLKELKLFIKYYRYLYYNDIPVISDWQFDLMVRMAKSFANKKNGGRKPNGL